MIKNSRLLLLFGAVLISIWTSSCSLVRHNSLVNAGMPANVAVLPVNNKSQDMAAGILVRFFLEKELKSKGFRITVPAADVDRQMREMGVIQSDLDPSTIQYVGQFLKVGAVMQSTLLEFRNEVALERSVIRGNFRLYSIQTGAVIWEKEMEIEEKGFKKIPVRGVMDSNLTEEKIRSIAKGPAGNLPKKLVNDALKTLHD